MREHDYTTLFKTAHMLKDVRLCLEEAESAGVPFPAAAHARDVLTATDGPRARRARLRRDDRGRRGIRRAAACRATRSHTGRRRRFRAQKCVDLQAIWDFR